MNRSAQVRIVESCREDGCSLRDTAPPQEWSRYYHDGQLPGIDVLHASFVRHRYARHAHEYAVIALVDRGAASYWYRGAQRTASAGQVFVVNPGESHTGDPAQPGGYLYRVVYPHADYLAEAARDVGVKAGRLYLTGAVLDDPPLALLLSQFHARLVECAPIAECESLLLRALARLVTQHGDPRGVPRSVGVERAAVKTARDYMETHFAEDVSIAKLSGLSFLSPYYFARTFEREIGLPPHMYLESVRIRKAREFLDRGDSLVSAALSAGFADQSHLTNRFKRILGITPGQYVRKSKEPTRDSVSRSSSKQ